MTAEVEVRPVAPDQFEQVLPLIAAYQRFYEVEVIDEGRNREFFRRFLAPSGDGMLLGAWGSGAGSGSPLGYACLYWSFDSLGPGETVLMNDLYVVEAARGRGVGQALIEASATAGRERGAQQLEWTTMPDNLTAQRLYDATRAERFEWIAYEVLL